LRSSEKTEPSSIGMRLKQPMHPKLCTRVAEDLAVSD